LYFQVDDVEAKFRELSAKGVQFVHPPQKVDWGYGAELRDPTGYAIGLCDEVAMREKGQGAS
jgi:predicted enzyme related to lactoylglutathione lyase